MTTKVNTKDWRNLPVEQWNVTSVHAMLIDETARRFNAEYTPNGKGSLSQRWMSEKGMIKREIKNRGPAVVKRFIEICMDEYYTSDPQKYPYPSFGFMCGFMDAKWTQAAADVNKTENRRKLEEKSDIKNVDTAWF